VSDAEVKNRRNYQHNNALGHMDGDSLSNSLYEVGVSSLISDKSRVFKGGSWNDRPYWLSPGTRRFMQETQSASTVGFRCAQTYLGPPEGVGFKEGNIFGKRKQNARKKKK
jgi:formylglycine-generating enzyme required for sulfatase activity